MPVILNQKKQNKTKTSTQEKKILNLPGKSSVTRFTWKEKKQKLC